MYSTQRTIPADLPSTVRMSHTAVPRPRAHSPRCLPVPGTGAGHEQHHHGRDLTVDPGRPQSRSSCWSARSGSFPRGPELRAGAALSKVRAVFLSHPNTTNTEEQSLDPVWSPPAGPKDGPLPFPARGRPPGDPLKERWKHCCILEALLGWLTNPAGSHPQSMSPRAGSRATAGEPQACGHGEVPVARVLLRCRLMPRWPRV